MGIKVKLRRRMLKISLLLILIAGCVTTNSKPQKSKWKVISNSSATNPQKATPDNDNPQKPKQKKLIPQ